MHTSLPLPPYRHPTTLIAVDDDPLFLESLAFALGRDARVRAFTRAETALAALKVPHRSPEAALLAPLDAADLNELPGDRDDVALRLRAQGILDIAGDPERCRLVSAIVADYDMPGLDGIAFFKALGDTEAERILLTGKADERVAVTAFNAGLIDRFLLKQDPDVRAKLRRAVRDAETACFARRTWLMQGMLAAAGSFLADPAVSEFMASLGHGAGHVEHYLVTDPPGLLCRDAAGAVELFLIQSEAAIADHMAAAAEHGLDPDAVAALAAPGVQPWFAEPPHPAAGVRWARHPASHAGGYRISRLPAPRTLRRRIVPPAPGPRYVLEDETAGPVGRAVG